MKVPITAGRLRVLAAFWLFGLCNNYAYVIMLSAAEDIMDKQQHKNTTASDDGKCEDTLTSRHCSTVGTGAVLLADILPTLLVKFTIPFFMHRIPFGIRHCVVVLLTTASFLLVAFSSQVSISILGVVVASFGAGIGEATYLSLASHYDKRAISAWSSGTGGAGLVGALAYAALTDSNLANLSPKDALLVMLIVPVIFALAYWVVLVRPKSLHQVQIMAPSTWLVPAYEKNRSRRSSSSAGNSTDTPPSSERVPQRQIDMAEKLSILRSMLVYMVPLALVYTGEYLINQGLVQLIFFPCHRGWGLTRSAQYRWYQVVYQLGVFISRSSVDVIELNLYVLWLLPIMQFANAAFFFFESLHFFVPHIGIIFLLILFEGLFGGASYVNTFNAIHRKIPADVREYALGAASCGDSCGIVIAAFASLPLHNFVCHYRMPTRNIAN